MRKILLYLVVISLMFMYTYKINANSQLLWNNIQTIYNFDDKQGTHANLVEPTKNGKFITRVESNFYIESLKTENYLIYGTINNEINKGGNPLIIKINSKGNILWKRNYNDFKGYLVKAYNIKNYYIIIGITGVLGSNTKAFTIKLDENGNQIYKKVYDINNIDIVSSIKDNNEQLLIAGNTYGKGYPYESNNCDIYLIKLNFDGNIIWKNNFNNNNFDGGGLLSKTVDNSIFIAGQTKSATMDIFLAKMNNNGKIIKEQTFDFKMEDTIQSFIKLKDSGYLLTGFSYNTDKKSNDYKINILKINEMGNKEWEKLYSVPGIISIRRVIEDDDGFIIITECYDENGKKPYIIKINKNGSVKWTRYYDEISLKNIIYGDYSSNSFIIIGNYQNENTNGQDIFLMRINESGEKIVFDNFGDYKSNRVMDVIKTKQNEYLMIVNSIVNTGNSKINLVKVNIN